MNHARNPAMSPMRAELNHTLQDNWGYEAIELWTALKLPWSLPDKKAKRNHGEGENAEKDD